MENKRLFTEMNSLVDEVRYDNKPILEQYISVNIFKYNIVMMIHVKTVCAVLAYVLLLYTRCNENLVALNK